MKSGEIVLLSEFDYEKRMSYEFKVQVTDLAQRSAVVSVHIHVIGVDEFAPIFTKETFRFQVNSILIWGIRVSETEKK